MAKVSYPEIDKLFETMDRKTAEKIGIKMKPNSTKKKTTTKKKTVKGKKK